MPDRKVVAGALAGALATIVVWAASLGGVAVPPEVAAALATILGLVVAYLIPERAGTWIVDEVALIDEPESAPTDADVRLEPIRPEDG
jgi:hypothetical protein